MTEEENKRINELFKFRNQCIEVVKPVEMACGLCIKQEKCELLKELTELIAKRKAEEGNTEE